MNHDPVYNRLRELSWRRPLTANEQAELRAWLAAHPGAQAECEVEMNLSAALREVPDAPVPSNFTARVLQGVERDARAAQRNPGFRWQWNWRVLLPRAATLAVILGCGLVAYRRHEITQQAKLMERLAETPLVANPAVLEDFDAIRRFGATPAPDEELLALLK